MTIRGMLAGHAAKLIGAVAVGWWLVVVASGAGFNLINVAWDFQRTALLGDSFGILSAIMASIAALFAFRTYQTARADSDRSERRAAEPSYLNLVERRYDVLNRVRHVVLRLKPNTFPPEHVRDVMEGQAALDRVSATLIGGRRERPAEPLKTLFDGVVDGTFGLSNYYRFTYHIVAYADRQFGDPKLKGTKVNPAYPYVRLLRAQLSESELVLIALNCLEGEGHAKFKPLVEDYGLLHNMAAEDIDLFGLRGRFNATAFGLDGDEGLANGDARKDSDPAS